jgi:hypothetical protein
MLPMTNASAIQNPIGRPVAAVSSCTQNLPFRVSLHGTGTKANLCFTSQQRWHALFARQLPSYSPKQAKGDTVLRRSSHDKGHMPPERRAALHAIAQQNASKAGHIMSAMANG